MSDFKKKFNNAKDKFSGKTKEFTGKVTGNEQLELKGKIQISKADFKKNTDIGNNIDKIKENLAGRVNDKIDARKKKK